MLKVNHNELAKKILNDAEIALVLTKKILASFLINKLGFDVHFKKHDKNLVLLGK